MISMCEYTCKMKRDKNKNLRGNDRHSINNIKIDGDGGGVAAVMKLPFNQQHLLHGDIIISKSQGHLMWSLLTH